jgi:tRNA pseudouridine13 synthase
MKIKCRPEDFRVEEVSQVAPATAGRYTLYRLTKHGIGTIEAVAAINRRWNLAGRRVSYAGLKDRHAWTTQYLTIADGPAQVMSTPQFTLEPVGKLAHPYGPAHIRGNRFVLVLRDLNDERLQRASALVSSIPREGLPNYFDDQRFGSVGASGEFIAHAWLRGAHERALELALAEPNPFDRSGVKKQKAVLRECWSNWALAKSRLERSSTRSIVTYLVDHPTDFRGAFARMRRELRTLYFSAFQSHVWNMILTRWIEQTTRPDQRLPIALKAANVVFPSGLDADQVDLLARTPIPLPSARNPLPEGPLGAVVEQVLGTLKLSWAELRIRHLKDVFFSKGSRAALFFPESVKSEQLDDELHPGRHALSLSFELPKGSYATIVVKRVTTLAD